MVMKSYHTCTCLLKKKPRCLSFIEIGFTGYFKKTDPPLGPCLSWCLHSVLWICKWTYLEFGQEVNEEFFGQNSQRGVPDMGTVHPPTHAPLLAGVNGEDILHCQKIINLSAICALLNVCIPNVCVYNVAVNVHVFLFLHLTRSFTSQKNWHLYSSKVLA